jgi:hypothetical protein
MENLERCEIHNLNYCSVAQIHQFVMKHPKLTELKLVVDEIHDNPGVEALEVILKNLKNLKLLIMKTPFKDLETATVKIQMLIEKYAPKLETLSLGFASSSYCFSVVARSQLPTPRKDSLPMDQQKVITGKVRKFFANKLPDLKFKFFYA